jgi:hypothetical protein
LGFLILNTLHCVMISHQHVHGPITSLQPLCPLLHSPHLPAVILLRGGATDSSWWHRHFPLAGRTFLHLVQSRARYRYTLNIMLFIVEHLPALTVYRFVDISILQCNFASAVSCVVSSKSVPISLAKRPSKVNINTVKMLTIFGLPLIQFLYQSEPLKL